MTVCVTGDIHHMSLDTRDQEYMDRTEVEAAIEYAEIAGEYDVPVTLFVTGKAAKEEPERVQRLAAMDHVEIGGHNYWAFGTPVHKGWRALEKLTDGRMGSWNGPRWFQKREIRKTIKAFEELGIRIQAWRDHAYRYDENTAELLAKYGITHFSDVVEPKGEIQRTKGLTVVPINTPPDHEHVYHAFRTPDSPSDGFEGPFGADVYPPQKWASWVLDYVKSSVETGGVATLLLHPACMDLANGFASFRTILNDISGTDTRTVREIDSTAHTL